MRTLCTQPAAKVQCGNSDVAWSNWYFTTSNSQFVKQQPDWEWCSVCKVANWPAAPCVAHWSQSVPHVHTVHCTQLAIEPLYSVNPVTSGLHCHFLGSPGKNMAAPTLYSPANTTSHTISKVSSLTVLEDRKKTILQVVIALTAAQNLAKKSWLNQKQRHELWLAKAQF